MNIIIAIIILSVIVIIHEFGHFILAKANGVAVNEFALGLGPTILKFEKGGTLFSLKLLPFGGACIMAGEDESGDVPDGIEAEKLFSSKSVWARISIIAAGPIFNFLLAFILAVFIIGSIGYDPCIIYGMSENSPAYEAGLAADDVITKINGKSINFYKDFSLYSQLHAGEVMEIEYKRDGEKHRTVLTPEYIVEDVYQLGVYLGEGAVISGLSENGAAKLAGFKVNDKIVGVNSASIETTDEAISAIRGCGGESILVTVMRDGELMDIQVTPVLAHSSYYKTGLSFYGSRIKTNPIQTMKYGVLEVKYWITTVFESLRMLVTGKVSKDDVAGPVGIVSAISDVVEQSKPDGIFYVILNLANWGVMISANLGVMNLLPIPALDGGRLLFLLIEAVRGKPIDRKKEGMVHFVGMVLLMLLMFFILFNDISKLF